MALNSSLLMGSNSLRPSALPEHLLGEGRHWLTIGEAAGLLGRKRQQAYPRLAELEAAGKLFSPAQGLYVVIPPEYRSWGAVPADWFIDPMMKHMKRDYYVAFLSAAVRHGAAHQAPQTFQVIVDRDTRNRDFGRVRLRFIKCRPMKSMPREKRTSHTGSYVISTPEATAVDMTWRPRHGGGMSNVATVLADIGPLSGEQLARLAKSRGRGTARRLGWLLENFRPDVEAYWLREIARPQEGSPAVLVPGNPPRGPIDRSWGLWLNGRVEPD